MYNNDLFIKMSELYSPEEMTTFSSQVSDMYEILFENSLEKRSRLSEYDFERRWWIVKYDELLRQK